MEIKTWMVFVVIDELRAKPLLKLLSDNIYIYCKTHLDNVLNIMNPNVPVAHS